jgi:DNA repair protein RecN (Recombination protein N)
LIQIQEAIIELRQYRDTIDLDDGRLDVVNDQIANMQNLARKHRVEVAGLAAISDDLSRELEQLSGSAFDLEAIQVDLQKALDDYRFSAGELSLKRQQTAELLSEQITAVMQQLGMDGGHFRIEVIPDQAPGSHGTDVISYRVSANPGQPAKSLARVASGGELSRISLAIQVIMSESSHIPTLIFDEVDTGVGGGVAHIVGKKLRLLGNERQVLCVTHLPQVASQAHHHFRVEKSSRDNHTSTEVFALDEKDRLEEIARMLGGINITEQTRAHASEMIATQE